MAKALSKQHYTAIAKILAKHNRIPEAYGGQMLDKITKDLADYFEQTNPNFNRDLFELAVWEGSEGSE